MPKLLPLLTSALCIAGTAIASAAERPVVAQLSDVRSPVFVDSGDGFAEVYGPVALRLGDRLMSAGEGGAVLVFGEGCALPVSGPEVTVVEELDCVIGTQGRARGRGQIVNQGLLIAGSMGPPMAIVAIGVLDTLRDEGPPPRPRPVSPPGN